MSTENRYYSLNRLTPSTAIVEITKAEAAVITDHIVWEIDPAFFPIQDDEEIKEYFKALSENPSGVTHLPGFDTIKTT